MREEKRAATEKTDSTPSQNFWYVHLLLSLFFGFIYLIFLHTHFGSSRTCTVCRSCRIRCLSVYLNICNYPRRCLSLSNCLSI
mmetsp:Transcript_101715/g.175640  ORF Transcript_101715/g.175640 Transcript_101715/m.175640 type:complete len:83 (-) Transcript_101715:1158-1406(-)